MINLARQHRAGKLNLFTPARKPGPPPGAAPAKERIRAAGHRTAAAGLLQDLRSRSHAEARNGSLL
jgi:hypothetical protein